MNANIKWKSLFIALVILACVYGLFGLPTSMTQGRDNFVKRIRLGLDLQGGTHLILQVQVTEAISMQTDQALDHLTTQLRDRLHAGDEQADA